MHEVLYVVLHGDVSSKMGHETSQPEKENSVTPEASPATMESNGQHPGNHHLATIPF